jgi:hypothetical protein
MTADDGNSAVDTADHDMGKQTHKQHKHTSHAHKQR